MTHVHDRDHCAGTHAAAPRSSSPAANRFRAEPAAAVAQADRVRSVLRAGSEIHPQEAAGRVAGTALSGLLFMLGGLPACLIGAALMLATCWALTLALPTDRSASLARAA